jgi:putative serine protease PepD
MGDVSEYDDEADRPDSDRGGDRHGDMGDTQPLGGSSYPPPLPSHPEQSQQPQAPGPYGQSFGQPVGQQPTSPYPTQPQPSYGYAPYAPQPQPEAAGGRGGFPGWAWPVITAIALVVGLLGGVIGAVAVNGTMSSPGTTPSVPVIGTDNGASEPLDAQNGSVAAVAKKLLPSTVQIQAKGGADGTTQGGATGSGFVLDDKDHVITNNHVVADATGDGELKVVDQNGKKHDAKIIGRSPVYDIAVLEVTDATTFEPVAIGSSRSMRVGDTVVAIGSPLGLSSTVTSGIISATDRPVTTGDQNQSSYINAVQTDAAINPGNSGGPLVNLRGQVVGVNSAIATTGGSVGGESGNIGVGFAIPMEQVRVTASQILATGKARYPVIGANVNTGAQSDGAEVVDVPSGTPAAAAGLKKGDIVTKVDGKQITDGISLIVAIRSHQPGETVKLDVTRSGAQKSVQVTLDGKVG